MNEEGSGTVHNVVVAVEDPNATDILKLIPIRMKHNLKHLGKTPKAIKCIACTQVMPLNIKDVIHHISQPAHLARSCPKGGPGYVYFCDICFDKFHKESKWQQHLDSKDHEAKCNNLAPSRKTKIKEYECLTCGFVFFGDRLSVIRHELDASTKKNRNEGRGQVILKPEAKKLLSSRQMCETILVQLISESDKALNDEVALRECMKAFEDCLVVKYPNYKAYPFGSRMTGTGTLKSDLDIFIDIGGMYNGDPEFTSLKQQSVMHAAKRILAEKPTVFKDIFPRGGARTPILQVVHIPTGIDCDLSFRSGLSVENTKFIKFCDNLQPVFRPVMLLLKKWGDFVGTKEEICSYALCMLMIFFLQQKKYLISVHKLRLLTDPNAPLIDNWSIITYNRTYPELQDHIKLNNKIDAYAILKDFFDYYKNFQFESLVVCPLLGYPVPVEKFKPIDMGRNLPEEMYRYKVNVVEDPECQFRVMMAHMFVQDPFDLGHNLTKAVPKHFVNKLKRLCALSSEQMRS